MHMLEVTICYGMTETSPVSTQTTADDDMDHRTSTVGRVHLTSKSRSSTPPRASASARHARRVLYARLQRHARLLERRAEQTAEAIDAGGLDAHRRPGDDGRRTAT